MRERADGEQETVEAAAQEGAAGPQGEHVGEAHSSWLGAAGEAQGQARRKARKARCEGHRARSHRRAAALAEHYSDLKLMGVEDLRDQLLGKTGFALSLPNRTTYVLQLQKLLLEANEDANDLEDGDSGIDGRSVRRRAT
eukprot:3201570-Pleurochrysis_carterae.AAC.1